MINPMIWVFRKHASFPEVGTGFQQVEPAVAEKMLADECAQSMDTDARRTKYVVDGVYTPKTMKAEDTPARRKSDEAPTPKRRSYKRRDITAEAS